ncbi:MAG: tetratricopeptide repeat protein, partial [Desulfovibrio sp.]|nr:tetratricopeptide repeat protein [Desulfovibrio sp.]
GAIADYEAILKKSPNNSVAALSLADAQFTAGNAALAENIITGVIQREPAFAQGYLALANLYLIQQRPDAALMTLSIGKTASPDDRNIAVTQADILTNLKRYDEAKKVLEELAGHKDMAETALFRLAAVHGQAKEHKQAVAVYDRILKLDPKSRMAAEGRIRAQIADKQEKAALEFAEKRQKQFPDDPSAAYMTGEAALAAKNLPTAEKAFLRAVELAPQWDRPLRTMIQIYMGTKRQDQAVKLCRDTMKKAPDSPQPAMILGMLHEQLGDLRSAEDVYRDILVKHPESLPTANNLAFLITRRNPTPERLGEAEEFARKATTSGSPSTFDTLGWIQHLRGNDEQAEISLRQALQGSQDNPFVNYHLAAVLAAQAEKAKADEAVALLEKLAKEKNFPLRADADKLLEKLKTVK